LLVWGNGREFMRNRVEHGVEMLYQFVVPKAFHAETIASQKIRALFVSGHICVKAVLASVNFDDELHLKANEIGDIRAYWLLAAKLGACKPATAKCLPKFALDVGLVSTQLAGKVVLQRISLICAHFPSPLVGEEEKSWVWAERERRPSP
jgi:hypothetical protein